MSSDISDLLESQPLPQSAVHADASLMKPADQGAAQEAANNHAVVTFMAGSVAAAVLVVFMLIVGNARRMRRKRRQQEADEVVIVQDIPGYISISTNSHRCNLV